MTKRGSLILRRQGEIQEAGGYPTGDLTYCKQYHGKNTCKAGAIPKD